MIRYRISWKIGEDGKHVPNTDGDWSPPTLVIEKYKDQKVDENLFICLEGDSKIVLGEDPDQYDIEIISEAPVKFRVVPREKDSSDIKI